MSRATACRSPYSLMSSRTIARSSSNRNSASARASSVLPTPVGPEEQERSDRPPLVAEPGARAPDRVRDRAQRVLLADHALAQLLLEPEELLHLALEHLGDRDARSTWRRSRRCPRR